MNVIEKAQQRMMDYTKLVEALRNNDWSDACPCCDEAMCKDADCIIFQAADAIEKLVTLYEKAEMDATNPTGKLTQAEAQLPKLGEWEEIVGEDGCVELYQCSECNAIYGREWNYCPNCGAKMREVQE